MVCSADNTLVGLLGASPGASVSPFIAIEVLSHLEAAAHHESRWHTALAQMIPSYGRDINAEAGLYEKVLKRAQKTLLADVPTGFASAKCNESKTFDRLDTDHSGTLSTEELSSHLEKQGIDPKSIAAIIKKMDIDGSGDINKEEFQKGFLHFATGQLTAGADDD